MKQFVAVCVDKPLDLANFLVLADWLEERGHPIVALLRHVVGGWGEGLQAWTDRGWQLTRNYLAQRVGTIDLEGNGRVRLHGMVPHRLRLFTLEAQVTTERWDNLPPQGWDDHLAEAALFLALLRLLTQRLGTPEKSSQAEPFASRQLCLALKDYEGMAADLAGLLEAGTTFEVENTRREALEEPSKVMVELLQEAEVHGVSDSEPVARGVRSAYEQLHRLHFGGWDECALELWRKVLHMIGQEPKQIMARIKPTGKTVALGFNLASTKLRNCYLSLRHVNRDMALFDRLLRQAFEKDGGAVCRVGGDEWLAFTESKEPELLVQGVADAFAQMTPFTWEWTFTARGTDGEERVARVTGEGLFERAFRCGMVRLVPGEEVAAQVEGIRERLWAAPLNAPFWLNPEEEPSRDKSVPRIQWLSVSQLSCPFCHMPVPDEGHPGCVDTVCAGARRILRRISSSHSIGWRQRCKAGEPHFNQRFDDSSQAKHLNEGFADPMRFGFLGPKEHFRGWRNGEHHVERSERHHWTLFLMGRSARHSRGSPRRSGRSAGRGGLPTDLRALASV